MLSCFLSLYNAAGELAERAASAKEFVTAIKKKAMGARSLFFPLHSFLFFLSVCLLKKNNNNNSGGGGSTKKKIQEANRDFVLVSFMLLLHPHDARIVVQQEEQNSSAGTRTTLDESYTTPHII